MEMEGEANQWRQGKRKQGPPMIVCGSGEEGSASSEAAVLAPGALPEATCREPHT